MTAPIVIRSVRVETSGAALRGVSLEVAAGERVAVVGSHQPSLSLLIRACAGFERLAAGTLHVAGVDVGRADRRQLLALRKRIGYVSIGGGLLSNLTLRENLEIALRYHGVAHAEAVAEVDRRVDAVELGAVAHRRACLVPAELQKCFAYLRALLFDPQVLLAEDPSAFLHPQGREIVVALHEAAAKRGTTVLIADDDDAFVGPIVDRIVNLEPAVEVAS